MGAGHHPTVKDEIDRLAGEAAEVLSRMSTWETMEDGETIPEDVKADLKEVIDEALELSMDYRSSDFQLELIRH